MRFQPSVRLAAGALLFIAAGACGPDAVAQFSGGPKPGTLPSPVRGVVQQPGQITAQQLQQIQLLRYLQSRSGGGVKRGVPQFVPFGQPFGNPAAMMQQFQQQPQTTQPAKDKTAANKAAAERRAEAEAQREERKKLTRERAEKRKQEAANRKAKGGPA